MQNFGGAKPDWLGENGRLNHVLIVVQSPVCLSLGGGGEGKHPGHSIPYSLFLVRFYRRIYIPIPFTPTPVHLSLLRFLPLAYLDL